MKALLQRVSKAQVEIENETVGKIDRGLLVLLGVEKSDSNESAEKLADRICRYRIFEDVLGKMNLSLADISGEILVVSQFTLVADTKKGTRPGFSSGANPELGCALYEYFVKCIKDRVDTVQTGRFGANMQVSLVNDGPVTFLLEV